MRIFFFQVLHVSPKFPYLASWCLLPPTWPHPVHLDLLGHHINLNDNNNDPMATMTIIFTSSHHHGATTTNAAKQRWPPWPSPHHVTTGIELPPPTMALQPIMTNATTFTLCAVVTRSPWQWHIKTTTTYITMMHQNATTMTTTTWRQYFLLLVFFFFFFFFFHSFTNVHTELHYHPGQPRRQWPTMTMTKWPPQPNDGQCNEDDNGWGEQWRKWAH